MGLSVAEKIIKSHLVSGNMNPGEEIGIRIDQTLVQDATGTVSYLEFEGIGIDRVKTEISVTYVDHNLLQAGYENADDHLYLQTVSQKYGIYFSKAGNGICHQVHLERFSHVGKTLLGADSHTPTCGGAGMLAIGAGGLEVACAMAGEPFYFIMPKIVKVELIGKPNAWISAKDVILELLRRLSVKGGIGKIFEYTGEGIKYFSVPERASITNMGAELGALTSIFPSDEITKEYFLAQNRLDKWQKLLPDTDAKYSEEIIINLSQLEPLIACPHSPDNVKPVREVAGIKIHQVNIGSCTNSSYMDLMKVAKILKGHKIHRDVSFTVSPGSLQVLNMLARESGLADILSAGARILEAGCGPCIGMGQAPPSGGISLRSFNRNFEGRAGTHDAQVYLASAETCTVSAIKGEITDPRVFGADIQVPLPKSFVINDSLILEPTITAETIQIRRGPNIKPLPEFKKPENSYKGKVLIKVGDNISTDHILPAGAKILPLRSNIPAISEFVFYKIDKTFANRAKAQGGGVIVGGENYGQGSSREHAAIAPYYLGIRFVIAKNFARIHYVNLINFSILPLQFKDPADYNKIDQNDELEIHDVVDNLKSNITEFLVINTTKGINIPVMAILSKRQIDIYLSGGLLNYIKNKYSTI
ncbi:MAG: aconitate hydratase [Planctomycetota bacterium]